MFCYKFNKHFCKNFLKKIEIEKIISSSCGYFDVKRNLSDENQNSFQKYLQSKIKMKGPITVAEYMKESLGNPKWVGPVVNIIKKCFIYFTHF
jgi:hypothetical protein